MPSFASARSASRSLAQGGDYLARGSWNQPALLRDIQSSSRSRLWSPIGARPAPARAATDARPIPAPSLRPRISSLSRLAGPRSGLSPRTDVAGEGAVPSQRPLWDHLAPSSHADAADLLALKRAHWQIENRLHRATCSSGRGCQPHPSRPWPRYPGDLA